jgi:protein SCO1/2
MRRALLALLLLVPLLVPLLPAPATAALTAGELRAAGIVPPPHAALPLGLVFRDEAGQAVTLGDALGGRPAVLVFADYTCTFLCGTALGATAAALDHTGLAAGEAFRLLVLPLDARDGPGDAAAMRAARLDPRTPLARAASFLTGDAAAVEQTEAALGYTARFDRATDSFAHPLGTFIIAPDGRVARVLSELGPDPATLRLALVEASAGRIGGLTDRIRLLCYGYDPVQGAYTPRIREVLMVCAALTLVLLAGGLLLLRQLESRR